eukprot:TRINITY_DN17481_c0_g1_i1.p1 TRINITY_DN17481_c0_g1~~TRINITY_DN17481_c0_g1_i1.p1  ORF type:complete len:108 (+),score=10.46 TRINITY_DN17481_c0_g1_i1:200-523(+)
MQMQGAKVDGARDGRGLGPCVVVFAFLIHFGAWGGVLLVAGAVALVRRVVVVTYTALVVPLLLLLLLPKGVVGPLQSLLLHLLRQGDHVLLLLHLADRQSARLAAGP